jgi:hypothetical protein
MFNSYVKLPEGNAYRDSMKNAEKTARLGTPNDTVRYTAPTISWYIPLRRYIYWSMAYLSTI